MRQKFLLIISIALTATFAGCNKNELINIDNTLHTITAKYDQLNTSKVTVNDNGTLTWDANDAFLVLDDNQANGVFTLKSESAGQSSGTFTGSLPNGTIKGAAFPFADVNTQPSLNGNTLTMNLPTTIEYSTNVCDAPMWAQPTTDMTSLSFTHLGSMLRLTLENIPQNTKQIIIEATSPLAGSFIADITKTGNDLVLQPAQGNDSKTITINFTRPDNGTCKIHVPIPVGTYNTFAISYAEENGANKKYLKTWNNLTFLRAWPNNTTIEISNINADTQTDYSYDSNTSTYTIKTKAGLYWFAEQVNSGLKNFNNEIVLLGESIDLSNENWTPINGFKGTFDGNNKTIYNLKAHVVDGAAGLFGKVQNCSVIKNINIENVDIKSNHYAGGVVGHFQENGSTRTPEISGCNVKNGSITVVNNSNDEGDKAGGIAGYTASDVNISNCTVTGLTIRGYRDLGGIVGIANTSSYGNVTISGCNVDETTKIIQDLSIQTKEYIPTTIDKVFGRGSTDGSSNISKATLIVEIPNVDALITFAKTINAHGTNNHHDFYQKTVKLTQELDLNNELWTPIGKNTGNGNFIGTFDGNNMIIKNLKVNETEGAGLFGFIKASGSGHYPTIKNVKINNVDINGNHYAGGVLGYGWGVTLTGCSVDGGTITVTPNIPAGEEKYDNGDKAGGVVGWIQLATTSTTNVVRTTMTGCSAENLTITAYRDLGGVAGFVKETASTNQFINNSASQISLNSNRNSFESNYKEYKDLNAGPIIGSYSSSNELDTSNTSTNVTLPNSGV